ncbi:hypothetical protein BBI08_02845 [Planococcus halocryophilus]|uniref:Uncharacterized protein n=1 Tax=Planococcus halocryophilus TaxID=1215089 RepID=A0A1C7DNP5_9BACL|nr:hypothetical protein BBI08_02845 [Planococcus halocryophilus]
MLLFLFVMERGYARLEMGYALSARNTRGWRWDTRFPREIRAVGDGIRAFREKYARLEMGYALSARNTHGWRRNTHGAREIRTFARNTRGRQKPQKKHGGIFLRATCLFG